MKLGSLFDGSGGFPLAGVLNGIEPVWASEIEPFPIRVTKNRFPNMKHLGSVTDINGAEIEPVDIITFGSPCQDLSVAGKQLGIHDGQRSNLFFEAIRIIKEMREHDRATGRTGIDVRPRFAVWENVPGAFSSNKGQDFQAVLQAICQIRGGHDHIVPMPPKCKWLPAGCIVGDGWSVAWRVYDAQFWGVPQRRKRIYLIADFGSERAGEILFECESVRGDSAESREAREGTAADAQGSAGRSDCAIGCDLYNGQLTGDKAAMPDVVYPINTMVATRGGNDDMQTCFGVGEPNDPQLTISAAHEHGVCYAVEGNTVDRKSNKNGKGYCEDVSPTLNTQDKHAVTYAIEGNGQRGSHQGDGYAETDKMYTLNTIERHAVVFEPKSALEENWAESKVKNALRAEASKSSHVVCFQQNQRDEVRNMLEQAGALTAEPGTHNQNYVCFRKSSKPGTDGSGERWVEDEKTNTLNTFEFHSEVRTPEVVCYPDKARSLCARADSSPCIDRGQNVVCVQNTGRGWWNEGEVAETLRTPCGGDSTKANLVVHALDCRNMADNVEVSGTIQAKNEGGHSLNFINPVVYDARGNGGGYDRSDHHGGS